MQSFQRTARYTQTERIKEQISWKEEGNKRHYLPLEYTVIPLLWAFSDPMSSGSDVNILWHHYLILVLSFKTQSNSYQPQVCKEIS